VLRPDGTLFLNIGDSYSGSAAGGKIGLKSKDLVGIPWMLAFALRADGWFLRSEIIWHKPNGMPESVTDRPTKAHEQIFLLTKSDRYFYDYVAVREASSWNGQSGNKNYRTNASGGRINGGMNSSGGGTESNLRSVWSIPTEPTAFSHFATFPRELVRRCLSIGTSRGGCCSSCGGPFQRQTERAEALSCGGPRKRADAPGAILSSSSSFRTGQIQQRKTTGWTKPCTCESPAKSRPLVLDPFAGSDTVGIVARSLNCDFIGFELNAEYAKLANARLGKGDLTTTSRGKPRGLFQK
jgi:DNA modification methylase